MHISTTGLVGLIMIALISDFLTGGWWILLSILLIAVE